MWGETAGLAAVGGALTAALVAMIWGGLALRNMRSHDLEREPAYPFRRTVVVNTKSGRAFRGVLWERSGGWLVLKRAEALPERSAPIPLDGDTLVAVSDIEFMQVTSSAG